MERIKLLPSKPPVDVSPPTVAAPVTESVPGMLTLPVLPSSWILFAPLPSCCALAFYVID